MRPTRRAYLRKLNEIKTKIAFKRIFVLFGWCMNRTTVLLESHAWSFNSMENSTQKRHVLLFMGHKNSCCEWHIKNGVGFRRRKIFLKVYTTVICGHSPSHFIKAKDTSLKDPRPLNCKSINCWVCSLKLGNFHGGMKRYWSFVIFTHNFVP